jgi:hypothetical protein
VCPFAGRREPARNDGTKRGSLIAVPHSPLLAIIPITGPAVISRWYYVCTVAAIALSSTGTASALQLPDNLVILKVIWTCVLILCTDIRIH